MLSEVFPERGMIGRLSMTDLGRVPLGTALLLGTVTLGVVFWGRAEIPQAKKAMDTRVLS